MKIEFKKLKEYKAKQKPEVLTIPAYKQIAITGQGSPNEQDFMNKVQILYKLAYHIKMKNKDAPTYKEYVVPPLEGIYTTTTNKEFTGDTRELAWTIFINQPSFITNEMFDKAFKDASSSGNYSSDDLSLVEFRNFDEGECVQILHIGPFETEKVSVKIIEEFLGAKKIIPWSHHEIYLSDYRKVSPEKLRTILRYKFK